MTGIDVSSKGLWVKCHIKCVKRWCIVHTHCPNYCLLRLTLGDGGPRCNFQMSLLTSSPCRCFPDRRGKMKFVQILASVEMCDFLSFFSLFCLHIWRSEWAVTISGGLWHDFDVFCCCFNHTASCFSVTARAVSIMKNVLPSLPLNQRVVES